MRSTNLMHILLAGAAIVAAPVGAQAAAPAAAQADAPANPGAKPDTDTGGGTQDIVVTAQKRSEAAQTVPITITAFNQAMLTKASVSTVYDLPRLVPTLKLGTTPGAVGTRYSIRGIGSFSNSALEPSVASFVDGIYVPRPASLVGTFLDIAGLEVLSGPQGTIFGRNASAGAINIRTGSPTGDFSGRVNAQAESGELYRLDGFVNIPAGENLAFRVAALGSNFGGYWTNTLTGKHFGGTDSRAVRVSMKANLAPNLVWNVKLDAQRLFGNGYINYQLDPSTLTPATLATFTAKNHGIAPDPVLFDRNNNVASDAAHINDTIWGATSDLALDLKGYTVRLLEGYHVWTAHEDEADSAGLSVLASNRNDRYSSKSHSHELQLISPKDSLLGGKLSFLAGLYYFHEDLGIDYSYNISKAGGFCDIYIGTAPAKAALYSACNSGPEKALYDTPFNQSTNSVAAYGQGTLKLLPTVALTLGTRFTRDTKVGDYNAIQAGAAASLFGAAEATPYLHYAQSKVTYRANMTWTPVRDTLFYATFSTGFKSGGFNSGSSTTVLGQQRLFQPETVSNYELGWKTRFFNRMLTFNANLYRMDVSGFQERASTPTGGVILRNAGNLRNQGFDVDFAVEPSTHLRANVSVDYLDSKFLSYPCAPNPVYIVGPAAAGCLATNTQSLTGKPVTYAPKWSVSAGAEAGYDIGSSGLRWLLRGDISTSSSQYMGSQIDESPLTIQPAYAVLGARLTLYGRDDRWSIAAFGRNLTDTGYCSGRVYNPLDGALGIRTATGTGIRCTLAAPRTFGVSASHNF